MQKGVIMAKLKPDFNLVKEIFHDVVDVLEKNEVKYWLDYGTLLGAVRGGDFIEGDSDADLSIMDKDKILFRELMIKLCEEKGYSFGGQFNGAGLQICHPINRRAHIDIFFWVEKGDMLDRVSYVKGTDERKGRGFPAEWVKLLSVVMIDGKYCCAPNDPEAFCKFRYGKDWRTPLTVGQFNRQTEVVK